MSYTASNVWVLAEQPMMIRADQIRALVVTTATAPRRQARPVFFGSDGDATLAAVIYDTVDVIELVTAPAADLMRLMAHLTELLLPDDEHTLSYVYPVRSADASVVWRRTTDMPEAWPSAMLATSSERRR